MQSWKSLILIAVLAIPWRLDAAETNPFIGTWRLDAASSNWEGRPKPSDGIRVYAESGDRILWSVKYRYLDGHTREETSTYAYDGKPYVITGNPGYDHISMKSNGTTIQGSAVSRGKVIGHTTTTISKDGMTLTFVQTYTDRSGQRVHIKSIWHRQ